MSWVTPKPTRSEKLESVGWEGEERTGPPWKHLRALNKSEKRVRTKVPDVFAIQTSALVLRRC